MEKKYFKKNVLWNLYCVNNGQWESDRLCCKISAMQINVSPETVAISINRKISHTSA